MVDKITNGIIAKIRAINTEKVTIYTDEHKQGLALPCYFVRLLSMTFERVVQDRYHMRLSYDIEYHSASNNAVTREYNALMSALCIQLEFISVEGKLSRYSNLSTEVQDGVLHAFVDYEVFLRKPPAGVDKMMKLTQNQGVK